MTTRVAPDTTLPDGTQTEPGTGTVPASPARARKRGILPFVLGAVLLLGGIWTFRTLSYARSHESTDNATIDGHVLPVLAKVGGFVTAVRVAENDRVEFTVTQGPKGEQASAIRPIAAA